MVRKHAWVCLGCVLVAATLCAAGEPPAPPKLNVLIIDGQHNHNWKATTPVLKDMLVKTGRFGVEVITTPDAKAPKEAWEKFKPDFAKYAAVVMNYHGTPWAQEVNKAFEEYMKAGGGLVFYHAAVFSFPKWEEWNKMMGMGWRDAKFGDRLTVGDDGKVVRTPKGEGPGGGHGPAHAFEVIIRDAEHPVMKGLPAKWPHVKDELYHGMRGPAENVQILATAFSDPKGKGTGAHEPMVWTVPYGKGRVFVCALGHDAAATAVPDVEALITRGTEWAATGKVTLPAPKDFLAGATGATGAAAPAPVAKAEKAEKAEDKPK